ncbi:hypothetical protein [Aquibium sp. ELW1220]|uniref:antitoxin Xre/MbcA/ParS-like domain-containing protein n=1 Tax=Aquibium sp. ELW1220 TaxID=2976766 RepID=UPI0025B1C291|nr:hypothetical protein [Aquibium sp. ELW1220]MDN2584332.1 hypothetical protein [Aquibium sp. ELW1220]
MADARKFSRARHRIKINRREAVEATLRSTIHRALREQDPTAAPGAVDVISELTAVIASQLLSQTQSTHRALKTLGDDIVEYGTEFVEQIVRDSKKDVRARIKKISAVAPPSLNPLLVADDWAGPVAGPTMIERYFGIPRSTLYRWQKRNEVVWLNTRTSKKPVFPLRQFVDGRPENGIAEVVQSFTDARAAWHWLLKPNPLIEHCAPIEKLSAGETSLVMNALKRDKADD